MGQMKHGSVTVVLPDGVEVSEKAGNLSKEQVLRLAKAQDGIAQACEEAASAITLAGPSFVLPAEVTAKSLQQAASQARGMDQVILETEHALRTLKQNRLLVCAQALQLVGQVNDQAQAQGKRQPRFLALFLQVIDYFRKTRQKPTPEEKALALAKKANKTASASASNAPAKTPA